MAAAFLRPMERCREAAFVERKERKEIEESSVRSRPLSLSCFVR